MTQKVHGTKQPVIHGGGQLNKASLHRVLSFLFPAGPLSCFLTLQSQINNPAMSLSLQCHFRGPRLRQLAPLPLFPITVNGHPTTLVSGKTRGKGSSLFTLPTPHVHPTRQMIFFPHFTSSLILCLPVDPSFLLILLYFLLVQFDFLLILSDFLLILPYLLILLYFLLIPLPQ